MRNRPKLDMINNTYNRQFVDCVFRALCRHSQAECAMAEWNAAWLNETGNCSQSYVSGSNYDLSQQQEHVWVTAEP